VKALLLVAAASLVSLVSTCENQEPLPEKTVIVLEADGPVDLEYYPINGQPAVTIATGLVQGDCYKLRTLYGRLHLRYRDVAEPGPRLLVVPFTPDSGYRCDPAHTY